MTAYFFVWLLWTFVQGNLSVPNLRLPVQHLTMLYISFSFCVLFVKSWNVPMRICAIDRNGATDVKKKKKKKEKCWGWTSWIKPRPWNTLDQSGRISTETRSGVTSHPSGSGEPWAPSSGALSGPALSCHVRAWLEFWDFCVLLFFLALGSASSLSTHRSVSADIPPLPHCQTQSDLLAAVHTVKVTFKSRGWRARWHQPESLGSKQETWETNPPPAHFCSIHHLPGCSPNRKIWCFSQRRAPSRPHWRAIGQRTQLSVSLGARNLQFEYFKSNFRNKSAPES